MCFTNKNISNLAKKYLIHIFLVINESKQCIFDYVVAGNFLFHGREVLFV